MSRNSPGKVRMLAAFVLAVAAMVSPAAAQCEAVMFQLGNSGFEPRESGTSVAVDGDLIIVGAPAPGAGAGCSPGEARIYSWSGAEWVLEAHLTPSDGTSIDHFGRSVAIRGDLVVVGATQEDASYPGPGSAYVFRHDPGSGAWVEEQRLIASDGEDLDFFGASVAVSGDRVVVGSPWNDASGTGSGSAYLFRYDSSSQSWSEEQKLTPSDGALGDNFGQSLALSDGVVLVGSPGHGDQGFYAGAVYEFEYDTPTETWVEAQHLLASDGGTQDRFGHSVSMSGTVAVIGAWMDSAPDTWSGSAYVFRHDGATMTWVEEQKIVPGDSSSNDHFGGSVSVSGDVIVVGAHNDISVGAYGTAYVFRHDASSGSWVEEQELAASDSEPFDEFGTSVAVSGELTVVGTPFDDDTGEDTGSAHVFRFEAGGSIWTEEQKLTISNGAEYDRFGSAVAVDGDVAVVGARGADGATNDEGTAVVYRYDAGSGLWNEEQVLLAFDAAREDLYGLSVAVSGNLVLVGAGGDDDLGAESGSAYLYRHDSASGTWDLEQKLTASDGEPGDSFGSAVSVSGDVVLVGAPGDDDLGSESGSAYLFRYDPGSGTWFEEQKLTASDGGTGQDFGWATSADSDAVLIGAYGATGATPHSGAAYVYRHDAGTGIWTEEQKLAATDGAPQDFFGQSVALSNDTAIVGAERHDHAGPDTGSAFLFRLDVGTGSWVEEQELSAPDVGVNEAFFATSVALSGDLALVGFPMELELGPNSGAAYLYSYDPASGSWTVHPGLTGSQPEWSDFFGSSVALSDTVAIVGSPGRDSGCLPVACVSCESGAASILHLPACIPAPDDLTCQAGFGTGEVELSWTNPAIYAQIDIFVDGAGPVATLPGSTMAYTVSPLPPGDHTICVRARVGSMPLLDTCCQVAIEPSFARGDGNNDGVFDIGDPVHLLSELFSSGPAAPCADSADSNDDGLKNIGDAIYSLGALFSGGPSPPMPFPGCGVDPTADELDCLGYTCP